MITVIFINDPCHVAKQPVPINLTNIHKYQQSGLSNLLFNIPMAEQPFNKEEERFVPIGTIVFITLLLALTALIWFSLYNLQLERHY